MKRKKIGLLKLIYLSLIAIFTLISSACNKEDNSINPEEDKTIYIELNALADGFGNQDGIAQNEEITKINDFFNTNDELWGFMALGLSYLDTTRTSISPDTLSTWLKKPNYYLPGPYSTEQIQNDLDEIAAIRWSVYIAFVVIKKDNKYYVPHCYKVFHSLVKQWENWTEFELK